MLDPARHAPRFSDLLDAAARLRGLAHVTPVLRSRSLDALAGCELYFKAENLQRAGAFKFRGAANAVFSLTPEQAARGVVTQSSGNHGAAVALACRLRGIPCTVVVPHSAPRIKREAIARNGARIVDCEVGQSARDEATRAVLEATGGELIHPFNDARVIAGQGTATLELLGQVERRARARAGDGDEPRPVMSVMGALSVRFIGEIYDRTGDYNLGLWIYLFVDIAAAGLILAAAVAPAAAQDEAQRVARRGREGRHRISFVVQDFVAIDFENQWNLGGILGSNGFDKAQGRGVRIATRFERELRVIVRIVAGRIGGETARGAVFEALIDGQDHELARTAQPAVAQQPHEVRLDPGILRFVPGKDFLDLRAHPHGLRSVLRCRPCADGCPHSRSPAGDEGSPAPLSAAARRRAAGGVSPGASRSVGSGHSRTSSAPSCRAMSATRAKRAAGASRRTQGAPARRAASARPGSRPQSTPTGRPRTSLRAAQNPAPANRASPGAVTSTISRPRAAAAARTASPSKRSRIATVSAGAGRRSPVVPCPRAIRGRPRRRSRRR